MCRGSSLICNPSDGCWLLRSLSVHVMWGIVVCIVELLVFSFRCCKFALLPDGFSVFSYVLVGLQLVLSYKPYCKTNIEFFIIPLFVKD